MDPRVGDANNASGREGKPEVTTVHDEGLLPQPRVVGNDHPGGFIQGKIVVEDPELVLVRSQPAAQRLGPGRRGRSHHQHGFRPGPGGLPANRAGSTRLASYRITPVPVPGQNPASPDPSAGDADGASQGSASAARQVSSPPKPRRVHVFATSQRSRPQGPRVRAVRSVSRVGSPAGAGAGQRFRRSLGKRCADSSRDPRRKV